MVKKNLYFISLVLLAAIGSLTAQTTQHAVNDDGGHEITFQLAENDPCTPPFFRSGGSFSNPVIGDESSGGPNSDYAVFSFDTVDWTLEEEYRFFVNENERVGTPFADLGPMLVEILDAAEPFPGLSTIAFGQMIQVAMLADTELFDEAGIDLTQAVRNILTNVHERYLYVRLRFQTCTDSDGMAEFVGLHSGGTENPLSPRIERSAGTGELTHKLYFAQFADGTSGPASLASQLVLLNPSDLTMARVRVLLQTDAGGPLTVDLSGEEVEGSTEFMLEPGGITALGTDGLGMLQRGSVVVCSNVPVFGTVLFEGSVGFAGVGSSVALRRALVPVRADTAEGSTTGIAVMSVGDPVSLQLTLKDRSGMAIAQATLDLAANGQDARFAEQYEWDQPVDFSDFAGSIEVSGDADFAAIVILLRPNQFATLPVQELAN